MREAHPVVDGDHRRVDRRVVRDDEPDFRRLCAEEFDVGQLHGQAEAVPPMGGMHDGDELPRLVRLVLADEDLGHRHDAARRHVLGRRADFGRAALPPQLVGFGHARRVPHFLLLLAVAGRLVGRHNAQKLPFVLGELVGPWGNKGQHAVVPRPAGGGHDRTQRTCDGRLEWQIETARVAAQGRHEADLGREVKRGVPVGFAHRDAHDGVDGVAPIVAGELLHVLDDGRAGSAPAVVRMDRHGDFDAVCVVEQRELEQSDAQNGAVGSRAGRHHPVALRLALESGKGREIAQGETPQVGPKLSIGRRQYRRTFRQSRVVVRIDPFDSHRITLPRVSGGLRRTPFRPPRCSGPAACLPPRR